MATSLAGLYVMLGHCACVFVAARRSSKFLLLVMAANKPAMPNLCIFLYSANIVFLFADAHGFILSGRAYEHVVIAARTSP